MEQEKTGFVYLVADMKNMVVKIGWTGMRHYYDRLNTLQSGYPFDLTPLVIFEGTLQHESMLLGFFHDHKVRPDKKGEWFYLADSLLAFIEVMKGGVFGKTADLTKLQTITWRQNHLDPAFQLEEARKVTRHLG